jgi:group I intron endonuclease
MIGIYKITSPSGRIYIGQSINIKRRFKEYNSRLGKGQLLLNRSFLKYGVENHIFEIICFCEKE